MDARVLGIAVVAIALVFMGVLYLSQYGSGVGSSSTTTSASNNLEGSSTSGSTQSFTSQSSTVSTGQYTTSGVSTIDIEGTWSGSYTSQHGSGEWTWVIKRTGSGSYIGCIKVSGVYPSEDWMPVTVDLDGDRIKVGTVGGYAALFDGRVSGDTMEGTWRFTNGFDHGTWSGRRVNHNTELPCSPSYTSGYTGSSTSHVVTTSTSLCSIRPPSTEYSIPYYSMYNASIQVFGSGNVWCYYSGLMGSNGLQQYYASFNIQNYDNTKTQEYAERIKDFLQADGWSNVTVSITGNGFQVYGIYIVEGKPMMGLLSVLVETDSVVLTIQIQPYM